MRVVWGEMGKRAMMRAGAGSVCERKRYGGRECRSVCERWQVLRRVVQGGRCKRAGAGVSVGGAYARGSDMADEGVGEV